MTDEKVTADEIIAAMRVADAKKKSGKGGSASLPTPNVDPPNPAVDVPADAHPPVSWESRLPDSLDEMLRDAWKCLDDDLKLQRRQNVLSARSTIERIREALHGDSAPRGTDAMGVVDEGQEA